MAIYTSRRAGADDTSQWTAVFVRTDHKLIGYGDSEAEAIADLRRLLGEKAECDRQEKPPRDRGIDAVIVEALIDANGVDWMLETLSEICGVKAVHLAESWQGTSVAKRWASLEGAIGVLVPAARGL
jgi:hypothetical protein